MTKRLVVIIVLFAFSCCCKAQDLLVKHADVPQYPQLAIQARLSGTLRFHVTIKAGTVTGIEPDADNPPNLRILADAALSNIRGWSFYDEKAVFDVEFIYEISRQEVVVPENPRIELNLPHSVKLIASPVKPTVNYEQHQ